MKYLLLLMLLGTPAFATTNEVIVGKVEVCPGVFKMDSLIDGNFIDTYYDSVDLAQAWECANRLEDTSSIYYTPMQ